MPDEFFFKLEGCRRSAAEKGQQKKCNRTDAAAEMKQRRCSRGGAGEEVQRRKQRKCN